MRRWIIIAGCAVGAVLLLAWWRGRGKAAAANAEALTASKGKASPLAGAVMVVEPAPVPAAPASVVAEKTKAPAGNLFAYSAMPGLKGFAL